MPKLDATHLEQMQLLKIIPSSSNENDVPCFFRLRELESHMRWEDIADFVNVDTFLIFNDDDQTELKLNSYMPMDFLDEELDIANLPEDIKNCFEKLNVPIHKDIPRFYHNIAFNSEEFSKTKYLILKGIIEHLTPKRDKIDCIEENFYIVCNKFEGKITEKKFKELFLFAARNEVEFIARAYEFFPYNKDDDDIIRKTDFFEILREQCPEIKHNDDVEKIIKVFEHDFLETAKNDQEDYTLKTYLHSVFENQDCLTACIENLRKKENTTLWNQGPNTLWTTKEISQIEAFTTYFGELYDILSIEELDTFIIK